MARLATFATLLLTLSACARSLPPAPVVVRPSLPSAPTDLRPVAIPQAKVGQNPKEYAARLIGALADANDRLDRFNGWYSDVYARYGAEGND